MADPKVRRPQGPNGGDTLEVASGGTIKILSGGALTPSSGSKAAHVAAASTSTGAGTFSTDATENTNIQSIAKAANAAVAALKNIGVMATSA